MYDVIGTNYKEEIVIESSIRFEQALKVCEEWGWFYNDGHSRFTMSIRERKDGRRII